MSLPDVSVIIPTYNRPEFLKRALESLRQQFHHNFEAIIIDDGSLPPVGPLVSQFQDARFHYFHQENQGLCAARNRGIDLANGCWIAFLDDDDEYLPEKLALQVNYLEQHSEIGMVFGGHQIIDHRGQELLDVRPWIHHDLGDVRTWLFGNPTVPSVPMISKIWLDKVGGFDGSMAAIEDTDMWLRLVYAGCKTGFVDAIVTKYFLHAGGMSRGIEKMRLGRIFTIEKFYTRDDVSEDLIQIRSSVIAQNYINCAIMRYSIQNFSGAKADLAQAISISPESFENPDILIQIISNHAGNGGYLQDPIAGVELIFRNLPPQASHLEKYRKKALAAVTHKLIFQKKDKVNKQATLQQILMLARLDLLSIFDRGILMICFESIFGKWAAGIIRKIF